MIPRRRGCCWLAISLGRHCFREKGHVGTCWPTSSSTGCLLSLFALHVSSGQAQFAQLAPSEGHCRAGALADNNSHKPRFFLLFLLMKPQVSSTALRGSLEPVLTINCQPSVNTDWEPWAGHSEPLPWAFCSMDQPSRWTPVEGSLLRTSDQEMVSNGAYSFCEDSVTNSLSWTFAWKVCLRVVHEEYKFNHIKQRKG